MSESTVFRAQSIVRRLRKHAITIMVVFAIALASTLALPAQRAQASVCAQPAHAWFGPSSTVVYGGSIYLAAVAYPGTDVEFRFKTNKQVVATATIGPAHSNCVVDHQYFQVFLDPGTYSIRALFIDENGVSQNVPIGSLTVTF